MSIQKETITIAVLINAGLLLILFATGVVTGSAGDTEDGSLAPVRSDTKPLQVTSLTSNSSPVILDEVDQVLQAWSQPSALPALQESGAVASVAAQEPAETEIVQVTVKKGDFLERIAKAYGAEVQEVMDLNQLETAKLYIGQVLKVPNHAHIAINKKEIVTVKPEVASPVKKESVTKKAPVSKGEEYYVVKSGDNPWTIANKHQMKLEELLKLNHLDEKAARKLKPGDKLRVK